MATRMIRKKDSFKLIDSKTARSLSQRQIVMELFKTARPGEKRALEKVFTKNAILALANIDDPRFTYEFKVWLYANLDSVIHEQEVPRITKQEALNLANA